MAQPRLDGAFFVRWMDVLDVLVSDAEGLLTELDAAIGDADHGANMTRGLRACRAVLAVDPPPDPAVACGLVGEALVRSIGGASGPLYGSIFIGLGRSLPDLPEIRPADLAAGLRGGLRDLHELGAAVVGDKTMIDAIAPAVAEVEHQVAARVPLAAATAAAARAAEIGAKSTIPLRARKGRASYLGPRSEGHQDPGATSSMLLFRSLNEAVGR